MLKEDVYRKASEYFCTPVGVAHITGYKNKKDHVGEVTVKELEELSDELDINWIITSAIERGVYKELQREIFRIERDNKRIKKELSIYKRAWKMIKEKKDGYNNPKIIQDNAKPSKVL